VQTADLVDGEWGQLIRRLIVLAGYRGVCS
jgi:hypothetical protein